MPESRSDSRPCGCERDPAVFGHDHGGEAVPWIMRAIWHAPLHVPAARQP